MQSSEVGEETEFGVRGLRPLWARSEEEGTSQRSTGQCVYRVTHHRIRQNMGAVRQGGSHCRAGSHSNPHQCSRALLLLKTLIMDSRRAMPVSWGQTVPRQRLLVPPWTKLQTRITTISPKPEPLNCQPAQSPAILFFTDDNRIWTPTT